VAHKWRFFRAGGVDQVQLSRGAELAHLGELDQKLWVALACPVSGLEIDKRTLELIDSNKDGRVRAPELIAAANWTTALLKDPESLVKGSPALPLELISTDTEEGREILATAKALLASAGKPDATELHIADVGSASVAFSKQVANGDGIVPPESVSDATLKAALTDIVGALPSPPVDKGGAKGVNSDALNAFLTDLDAYVAWLEEGKNPVALPLGEATTAAFDALSAVRAKIEDFFSRTRFAAYDLRALEAVNPEQAQLVSAGNNVLSANASELSHFPIARVTQSAGLPLRGPMNPAWADRMQAFNKQAVEPAIGARDSLTPGDFSSIVDKLAGHSTWRGKKPSTKAAELSPERALALHDPSLRAQLKALIAADEAEKPKAAALEKVERLVHLHRDLFELANNFVAFRAFYNRKGKPAAFQFGTLFLDQRECELVLRVDDAAKHALLGPLSKCYLVYCDIKSSKGEKLAIVAVLSNGDGDNIMVGRNGLFYDRHGMDWDATVTKVIDNPISVRAAFWSPYKKAMRTLEEFVARRAAAAEAESDAKMGTAVSTAQTAVTDGAPKPAAAAPSTPTPPKPPPKLDIGVVAALGVAVGGITAALGALLNSFFGLGVWMPIGMLGLLLAISGPSMAVAWLKLRQRNIGPLLDANGWAVNARAKLNVPLGESMTRVAELPKGAARDFTDPFAEKTRPWGLYIFLIALLTLGGCWFFGKLDRFLPVRVQSTELLGDIAPAKDKDEPKADAPKAEPAK
jgi:hypothetical protein